MKELNTKTKAPVNDWQQHVIGTEDPGYREYFDFRLHMHWIETVIDELDSGLQLMVHVFSGIQTLENADTRGRLNCEIKEQLRSGEIDNVIKKLKAIQREYGFDDEISEVYVNLLDHIQNLREIVPIEEEVLQPFFRKRSDNEEIQLIRGILTGRERICNLRKKDKAIQSAIDETKYEIYLLEERSPSEIAEMVNQSELDLIDLKMDGDRKFARLEEEIAKKVLDLDKSKEYQDLISEHAQKRRKIGKLTTQLQLWIKQYDKFVGEPMKELVALEQDIDQFPEWKQTVYDPQEERFNELLYNVEVLEAELIEEQVERFRIEHAARILQRAWRGVLEKKKAKKKKGKKGKKGKKKK